MAEAAGAGAGSAAGAGVDAGAGSALVVAAEAAGLAAFAYPMGDASAASHIAVVSAFFSNRITSPMIGLLEHGRGLRLASRYASGVFTPRPR